MLNSIQSVWPHVVGQAWADAAFRERLLSDPQSVLAEFGVSETFEKRLVVVTDTPERLHLILPLPPPSLDGLARPLVANSYPAPELCTGVGPDLCTPDVTLCTADVTLCTADVTLCTADVTLCTHSDLCTSDVHLCTHSDLCTSDVHLCTGVVPELCTGGVTLCTHSDLCTGAVHLCTGVVPDLCTGDVTLCTAGAHPSPTASQR